MHIVCSKRRYKVAIGYRVIGCPQKANVVATNGPCHELEWLIRNKSWWDTVDLIASNYLGKYIRLFPDQGNELIEDWRQSGHLWLQRSCLIFQLKYGKGTDRELLTNLIKEFVGQKEFFIQKAIGWSLRQLSKTDPESVKRILKEIPLKGVALREASKYL